jgi:hypothetical protein
MDDTFTQILGVWFHTPHYGQNIPDRQLQTALKFAIGLDDHNDSARKHDIVDLLEPEPYAKTWQEYQRGSSHFPLVEDDLVVEGTA